MIAKAFLLVSVLLTGISLDLCSALDPGRRFTNVEQIPNSLEVVMRKRESISDGKTRYYHGGSCFVDFPHNGRLKSGRTNSDSIPFEANKNSLCSTLNGKMVYKLQGDGNLVCRCDGIVDYTSQTDDDGASKDYVMAIDKSCILRIYGGTMDCDKIDLDKELFASHHVGPLGPGDVVGKGEHVLLDGGRVMIMDSESGDLIIYEKNRQGGLSPVWRASEYWEWEGPEDNHYYYATITRNGYLILVDYDYDSDSEFEYFFMDLGTNGESCFTLHYSARTQGIYTQMC